MGLNLTPEIEARIVENAREAGLSPAEFLDRVIGSYEDIAASVRAAEAKRTPLRDEEFRARLEAACSDEQLAAAVDGETFMKELLGELDEMERRQNG